MHIFPAHFGDRNAVNLNYAAVYFKEAHQQVDHRCFSGAGRADDGNLLTGMHLGGEILNDNLIRSIRVAEADMLKADRAANIGKGGRFLAFIGHFFPFKKVKNAVRGGGCGLRC